MKSRTRQTGEWSVICTRPTLLTLAWASGRALMSNPVLALFSVAFYIKIYLTVWRHKNQIQSVRIREEAQSDKMKKFAALIKSTISIF